MSPSHAQRERLIRGSACCRKTLKTRVLVPPLVLVLVVVGVLPASAQVKHMEFHAPSTGPGFNFLLTHRVELGNGHYSVPPAAAFYTWGPATGENTAELQEVRRTEVSPNGDVLFRWHPGEVMDCNGVRIIEILDPLLESYFLRPEGADLTNPPFFPPYWAASPGDRFRARNVTEVNVPDPMTMPERLVVTSRTMVAHPPSEARAYPSVGPPPDHATVTKWQRRFEYVFVGASSLDEGWFAGGWLQQDCVGNFTAAGFGGIGGVFLMAQEPMSNFDVRVALGPGETHFYDDKGTRWIPTWYDIRNGEDLSEILTEGPYTDPFTVSPIDGCTTRCIEIDFYGVPSHENERAGADCPEGKDHSEDCRADLVAACTANIYILGSQCQKVDPSDPHSPYREGDSGAPSDEVVVSYRKVDSTTTGLTVSVGAGVQGFVPLPFEEVYAQLGGSCIDHRTRSGELGATTKLVIPNGKFRGLLWYDWTCSYLYEWCIVPLDCVGEGCTACTVPIAGGDTAHTSDRIHFVELALASIFDCTDLNSGWTPMGTPEGGVNPRIETKPCSGGR